MRPGTLRQIVEDTIKPYGLNLEWVSISSVKIKAGKCADSTRTKIITLPADLTISLATSGKNGLDAGSEAANMWYPIWLLHNPDTEETAGVFSASFSAPSSPPGFTQSVLIHAVRNNSGSDLFNFVKARNGSRVETYWLENADTTLRLLSGGAATTFTTVNLSSLVSPIAFLARIQAEASTQELWIRPGGSSLTSYGEVSSGGIGHMIMPTSATQTIEYRNAIAGGSSNIEVFGYIEDNL